MAITGAVAGKAVFANRWWIVAASVLGNAVGPGAAITFASNVFLLPVTRALHISRGLFFSALLINVVVSSIVTPIFRMLFDRYGIRRIALPTSLLYGLSLCGLSLLSRNRLWLLYALMGIGGCFGACFYPILYSKAITAWFDRQRGLALGVAVCGVGLGTLVIPMLCQYFISQFGWRAAYVAIGIIAFVISFGMILLFVREPLGFIERMRAARTAITPAGPQPSGISLRAALGRRQFWLLNGIMLAEGTCCNGILSGNFVPLLIDRGYTTAVAVGFLSATGLTAMASRIVVGFALDWVNGPILAALLMSLPPIGVGLLLSHAGGAVPLYVALLLGFAIGAEINVMSFFVSRYFGRRSFGTIYGIMFGFFLLGNGVGSTVLGHGYDVFHSYDPVLKAFLVVLAIAATLFLPLGKYTYPEGTG